MSDSNDSFCKYPKFLNCKILKNFAEIRVFMAKIQYKEEKKQFDGMETIFTNSVISRNGSVELFSRNIIDRFQLF